MMSPHYGVVRTLREYVYICNIYISEWKSAICTFLCFFTVEVGSQFMRVPVGSAKISKDATCH